MADPSRAAASRAGQITDDAEEAPVPETTSETAAETATEQDHRELDAWFARYDAHAADADVEAMAAMALFPLNLVTDDAAPGSGWAGQWSREEFVRTMSGVMGEGSGEKISFESRRTPHFLSRSMAVVFTESTMTVGGESRSMRYADVLVKQGGEWFFQTMLQSGWAAMLAGPAPDPAV